MVGDGDPHTLIRPDTIRPSTATELLEQILARDDSTADRPPPCCESSKIPPSGSATPPPATSTPSTWPPKHLVGQSAAQALEASANQLVPGLTDEPAWPTLRAHLLLLAAAGADPAPNAAAPHATPGS